MRINELKEFSIRRFRGIRKFASVKRSDMSWLNKIKRSDENSKKKWIIFLSGISMAVVIVSWVWYMDSYISDVGVGATGSIGVEETKFWPIFKTGLVVMSQSIKEKISGLSFDIYSKIPKIGEERIINIENP